MSEYTGWQLWVARHLPWYDHDATEARHAHDAKLRHVTERKRGRWSLILDGITADYARPTPRARR